MPITLSRLKSRALLSESSDDESSSDTKPVLLSENTDDESSSEDESSCDVSRCRENESESSEDENEEKACRQTSRARHDTMYQVLYASRQAAAALFRSTKPNGVKGRHVSGQIPFKALDIDEMGIITPRDIRKSSGYDENFRCDTFEKLKKLDKDFDLEEKPVNFQTAFFHSRLPTHSYIHFKSKDKKKSKDPKSFLTTGHSGGFFKPLQLSQRRWSMPDIRSLSISQIESLTGTKGENKVGSVGKGAGSFHGERQEVINKVTLEAESGSTALQEACPVKATVEALKYGITHTVGYRDNTLENDQKFSGITTDGLNLEDPISREYALKHYQACRDAAKLAVLKMEGRLNESDSREPSDVEETNPTPKRISRLNRKLARTVLEEKYHGPIPDIKKRNLSPLRSESPYSIANVDVSLNMLDEAKTYEEVSSVYNAPIPVIHPTLGLFAQEDKQRAAESEKQSSLRII